MGSKNMFHSPSSNKLMFTALLIATNLIVNINLFDYLNLILIILRNRLQGIDDKLNRSIKWNNLG